MFEFVRDDPESLAEFNEAVAEAFDILGAEDEDEDEGEVGGEVGGVEGSKEKPKKKKKSTPLDRMNSRHAVVFMSGKTLALTFYEKQEVSFGTVNDLHIFYANDPMPTRTGGMEPVSAWWNRHPRRRSYKDGVVFAPGGCPETAYNLWRGFAVEPDPNASCELFLNHILKIICCGNEDHYRYVIGWLAHMIQVPEEKPGVALVLRGLKGTGKDTVGTYVGKLFPHNRVNLGNMKHLTGRFNSHFAKALLVHVEEGFWSGDHQGSGVLKNLITAPELSIERKGKDLVQMPSYVRLLLSSNDDWVVPASADERRYAVFDVDARYANQKPYFQPIYDERDNGGLGALLHHLQTFDLTGFDVRGAPQTKGLANQKLVGLKNFDGWWYDVLTSGDLDVGENFEDDWHKNKVQVPTKTLYSAYCKWVHVRHYQKNIVTSAYLGKLLKKACPKSDRKRPGGRGTRDYSYFFPKLPECRAAFATYMNIPESDMPGFEDDDDDDHDEIDDLLG